MLTPSSPASRELASTAAADVTDAVAELNRRTSLTADACPRDAKPVRFAQVLGSTLRSFLRIGWQRQAAWHDWRGMFAEVSAEFEPWLALAKRWERALGQPGLPALHAGRFQGAAPASGGERGRLTVLLITKNEEPRIERCLASVAWADQIVVVDGESTDRTAELCRRMGAVVISRPFSGSFGEERNAGLEAATGEWVLQLDADEVVTPQLRTAIERVLADRRSGVQGYQVFRRNLFLGHFMRHGGWYHRHLCLFRREGRRYHGLVHERLNIEGPIGVLRADLQHEPFQSLEQFVARQNRYTSLQAQELFETQGTLPWPNARRTLRRRPINRFWKFYVKKQGFREGMHGLVFSVLFAWVEFVYWVKYCELAYPRTAADLSGHA